MTTSLSSAALDQLFCEARTHNAFAREPVPEATLRHLYSVMKWGPTSMNCQPARLVFVTSAKGKACLLYTSGQDRLSAHQHRRQVG